MGIFFVVIILMKDEGIIWYVLKICLENMWKIGNRYISILWNKNALNL